MSILKGLKIGCIGTGNMGGAIISGLLKIEDGPELNICDTDKSKLTRLEKMPRVSTSASSSETTTLSDIIIVAVKPAAVPSVLSSIREEARGKTVISIAAGVKLKTLRDNLLPGTAVIRVMPNTPALISQGMSVLSAPEDIDVGTLDKAIAVFQSLGRAIVLPEHLMDAVTGVSGSGPAFVFTFIQALADGAVKCGISRNDALLLAAQTVFGSAGMVLDELQNPIMLRDMVASPAGTTIEGIHKLEISGFSGIVMDAVESAAKKSRALGGE